MHPPLRRAVALGATLATTIGLVAVAQPALADTADGLILSYAFDGSTAIGVDTSGHGHDATNNGVTLLGGAAHFSGSGAYLTLPDNLMAGLSAISVDLDVKLDATQQTPYFIYGLGNSTSWYGDGYLFTTGDGYRTSIASGNWSTEQTTTSNANLPRGAWEHLTYTQDASGTGILYLDGAEVARSTGITLSPGSIGGGVTTADYLGRSLYSGDKYLKGDVGSFRIYDRALTASDVQALAASTVASGLSEGKAALDLGDLSAVTANLALPTSGAGGTAVTWASSNPAIIGADGTVTRPAAGAPAAQVTLTATLTKGGSTATKQFTATVLPDLTDAEKLADDAQHLSVANLDDVRGNLGLPSTGGYGSAVSWTSSDPSIVDATGVVQRPRYGQPDATVTLTATLNRGDATATRAFSATVRAMPRKVENSAYMFAYFTGNTVAGEKISFAASTGADALHWSELNGGQPVLASTLGTTGLRDPFIMRSHDGDTFYLIATDLSIGSGTSWDASQRTGSRSLEIWESHDLVHWGAQRSVVVSPPTAGNTWAPEAYWDDALGSYVVFWASKIYDAADVNHTGSTYEKMMYSTTRDFVNFTPAQVWQDAGVSRIDTTVIKDGGTYYRFTKDEASASGCTDVFAEKAADLLEPVDDWTPVATCIGRNAGTGAVEGPTIFKANPGDPNGGYYLFLDEYGGRGYLPLHSATLDSPSWKIPPSYSLPTSPRHGTVMGITQAEWDALQGAAAPAVTSTTTVALSPSSVTAGGSPSTATVTVAASDGGEVAGPVVVTAGSWSTTAHLVDGTASVALPSDLPLGEVRVTASYQGYDVVQPSAGSATLTVLAPSAIRAVLAPATLRLGRTGKTVVHVSGSAGTPTGAVEVFEGKTLVGSATLSADGTARVALDDGLSAGTHSLTAVYTGDSVYAGSTAAAVTLTVTAK